MNLPHETWRHIDRRNICLGYESTGGHSPHCCPLMCPQSWRTSSAQPRQSTWCAMGTLISANFSNKCSCTDRLLLALSFSPITLQATCCILDREKSLAYTRLSVQPYLWVHSTDMQSRCAPHSLFCGCRACSHAKSPCAGQHCKAWDVYSRFHMNY